MNRRSLTAVAAVISLLSFGAAAPPPAAAFDHAWANHLLRNVVAGEFDLWDDVPAGGNGVLADEAGLLWFRNTEEANETVGFKTTDVDILTDTYPVLKARAATADGTEFRIGYAQQSPNASCAYPAELRWSNTTFGQYRVKSYTLPAGTRIRAICLHLTDVTDAVSFGRTTALIDYVRIEDGSGTVGWYERFVGSP